MQLLWCVIVGLVVGWMTGKRMKDYGYGAMMDIFMGIAGAVAGGFIMRSAGFSSQSGMIYTTLVAILGAVIMTLLFGFVSGRCRHAYGTK